MLIVALVALVLAWLVPRGNIYWITYFAGTLFASAWGPVSFMSVWSRRITEAAAFWGIISGFVGITIVSCTWFRAAGKHGDAIKALSSSNNPRALVIAGVCIGTIVLGMMRVLTGDQVSTLFAAIVGFVLGGLRKTGQSPETSA